MSERDDLERALPGYLRGRAPRPSQELLHEVLRATDEMPQRRPPLLRFAPGAAWLVPVALVVALVVVVVVGMQLTRPTGTEPPSPSGPVAPSAYPSGMYGYTVSIPVQTSEKAIAAAASDVFAARLRALGIGNFTGAIGTSITFDLVVPDSVDQAALDQIFQARGEVSIVTWPAGAAAPVQGAPVPSGAAPLFDMAASMDSVSLRSGAESQTGGYEVEIQLSPAAASVLGDYTAGHVGEPMPIAMDGTVLIAPTIQGPVTEGDLFITFGTSPEASPISPTALYAILKSGPLPPGWGSGTPPAVSATPAPSAVAGTVQPTSVSFIDSQTGWVLGTVACGAAACATVAETIDGGATWQRVSSPAVSLDDLAGHGSAGRILFANARDGWVFGGAGIWATHDGGTSWHQVSLPGWSTDARVADVGLAGDRVMALVLTGSTGAGTAGAAHLLYAPLATDAWIAWPGPFGTAKDAAIAGAGSEAWLWIEGVSPGISGPPLWVSADGGMSWDRRSAPCESGLIAVGHLTGLVVCGGGASAGSQEKVVYLSTDDARSYRRLPNPPAAGDLWSAAAPDHNNLFLGALSGAAFIYRTTDQGATWTTPWTGNAGYVTDLAFATPDFGAFALVSDPGVPNAPPDELCVSTDGGASWHVVPVVEQPGG
jgi:SecDF, P1 head subdomain/Photosynthesis system II assembly factor YCF48